MTKLTKKIQIEISGLGRSYAYLMMNYHQMSFLLLKMCKFNIYKSLLNRKKELSTIKSCKESKSTINGFDVVMKGTHVLKKQNDCERLKSVKKQKRSRGKQKSLTLHLCYQHGNNNSIITYKNVMNN